MLHCRRRPRPGRFAGGRRCVPRLEVLEARALPSLGAPLVSAVSQLADGAMAAGDFNGDGRLDVAVTTRHPDGVGGLAVLRGHGDGTLAEVAEYPVADFGSLGSLAVGDFNRDGKPDLALGLVQPDAGVAVLLGNGDGTFQSPVTYDVPGLGNGAVGVGDFTGDGRPDLVVSTVQDGVNVLPGVGDGTFRAAITSTPVESGTGLVLGDFNADAKLDLALRADAGVVFITGNGDGTFGPAAVVGPPGLPTGGDFDGDGRLDLAVTQPRTGSQNVAIRLGNGDGTFRDGGAYDDGLTTGLMTADFTGDGRPDLAGVALGPGVQAEAEYAAVLTGNGDGSFRPALFFPAGPQVSSANTAPGDFNGDGKADLAVLGPGHAVSVLLNQPLPPVDVLVGADQTVGFNVVAQVRGFDAAGDLRFRFNPYHADFLGGVRVARADLTGDGVPDLVLAPGSNVGSPEPDYVPPVRVLDGVSGWQVAGPVGSFDAYSPFFQGGVYVATGDINGDGVPDVITGAGYGGGPQVKVFDGQTGAVLEFAGRPDLADGFYAYTPLFHGGVRVAAGDVNGDGQVDIVTGAGAAGGPHVHVYDGRTLAEVRLNDSPAFAQGFYALDPAFPGGVFVAAADVDGDRRSDVIVGPGSDPNSRPRVLVFSGRDGSVLRAFDAFATDFHGGVRVAAGDVNGDRTPDIIAGAGAGDTPQVTLYDAKAGAPLDTFFAYDPSFPAGVFVGG